MSKDQLPSFDETEALPSFEDTEEVSQEELPKFEQTTDVGPEKMSKLRSGVAGFADTASFGLADEYGGLWGALAEKAGDIIGYGEKDPSQYLTKEAKERAKKFNIEAPELPKKDFSKLFEEYTELQRQNLKKAAEDQPTANLIGNIGGAVAIPGLGAAKGMKALSSSGQFLKRAAAGGGIGAAEGGLAGFGSSEGGIENRLKGATEGATIGGGIGSLIPGAGVVAKKGKKLLEDSPLGRIFTKSKEGVDLSGTSVAGRRDDLADEIEDTLDAQYDSLFNKLDDEVTELSDAGVKIDTNEFVNKAQELLAKFKKVDPDSKLVKKLDPLVKSKKVKDEFADAPEGFIKPQSQTKTNVPSDPVEFNQFIKRVKGLMNEAELSGLDKQIRPEMNRLLAESLPQNSRAFKEASKLKQSYEMLTGGKQLKDQAGAEGSISNLEKIQDFITKMKPEDPLDTSIKSRMSGRRGQEGIEKLTPEVGDILKTKGKDVSEDIQLSEMIENKLRDTGVPNTETYISRALGGIETLAAKGARSAGQTAKAVKDSRPGRIYQGGKTFIKKGKDNLNEIGARLRAKPDAASQRWGKDIERIMSIDDQQRRDALMFGLMQQPGFRSAIEEDE